MKKRLCHSITLLLCLCLGTSLAQTDKTEQLMIDALKAKDKLMETDPNLKEFFNTAAGYVIFPNVGKGGLIIGGASGNGILYENGNAIGKANLKKLNIGLQAGGQAIIEIIFFKNEESLSAFKKNDFSFDAEASAVAVKSGIAVNAKYKDDVAVFALPKAGLMANASVGGQKFSYEDFNSNEK